MSTLGEYLRKKRLELGLTLREVADRTRISNSYVSQIESGQRKIPSAKVLGLLARLYGVEPGHLMNLAVGDDKAFVDEAAEIDSLFLHVVNDPHFKYGTRFRGELSTEMKRAIIEMYEEMMNKELLRRNTG